MAKVLRRGLIGGAVAALMAGRAMAQNAPQANPDAEALQKQLQDFNDPNLLKVTPVGQDWANLHRYRTANEDVMSQGQTPVAVFMGDSITDNWAGYSGDWFKTNTYVGRGIGGQVSAQMLGRFMADVVRLKPQVVHIMAGTNDVAENLDPYNPGDTQNNLTAMCDMAVANGIRVVLASVPPATSFAWRPALGNRADMIKEMNRWLQDMCAQRGFVWCDYWPVLADGDALKAELGIDGDSVHPNKQGYDLMQPLAVAAISQALAKA